MREVVAQVAMVGVTIVFFGLLAFLWWSWLF